MATKYKIFASALDWGMGHTTRLLPLLLERNNQETELYIGVNSWQEKFFKTAFPEANLLAFPGYEVHLYASNTVYTYLKQAPKFFRQIKREHKLLQEYHKQIGFHEIISDHRYGCFVPGIKNKFVCHQLQLAFPAYLQSAQHLHRKLMVPFTEILVPDYEDNTLALAGDLSRNKNKDTRVKYIGPICRYGKPVEATNPMSENYVLVMLSGPEPQRTVFYETLRAVLHDKLPFKIIWVGQNGSETFDTKRLAHLIYNAAAVVSRCGYSSIMELHTLGKKAVLIPTKGQYEQEFLGNFLKLKPHENFKILSESELRLLPEILTRLKNNSIK